MRELATLGPEDARNALDAFLVAVPDARRVVYGGFVAEECAPPNTVIDDLGQFLAADVEHGRRAQAFVAACLALVHGDGVTTPRSVNDPSRRAPGDVTVVSEGSALAAESKWRTVAAAEVSEFSKVVTRRLDGGTALYGALVNADSNKPLGGRWRAITERTETMTAVYDDPATLFRDAVVWSAKPFPQAVREFCGHYLGFLQHIDVQEATVQAWLAVAKGWGISFTNDAD